MSKPATCPTCATCKHVQVVKFGELRVGFGRDLYLCNAPQNQVRTDAVTGGKLYRAHRADVQREPHIFSNSKYCGPHGNWHEVKNDPS